MLMCWSSWEDLIEKSRNMKGHRAIADAPSSTVTPPWGHKTTSIFSHFWVLVGFSCVDVSCRITSEFTFCPLGH